MKILKYILWVQLIICIILSLASYLKVDAVVHRVPRVYAYERLLKEEKNDFAKDKKNEINGFTPLSFSEFATMVAKDSLDSTILLFLAFLTASAVSLIELLILNSILKKEERYNKKNFADCQEGNGKF